VLAKKIFLVAIAPINHPLLPDKFQLNIAQLIDNANSIIVYVNPYGSRG
jgi:hypothetical protein